MTSALFDDSALFMEFSSVCNFCARHDVLSKTCAAFPDGIPEEIWSGSNTHEARYEGDHGLQYVPAFPGAHPLGNAQ